MGNTKFMFANQKRIRIVSFFLGLGLIALGFFLQSFFLRKAAEQEKEERFLSLTAALYESSVELEEELRAFEENGTIPLSSGRVLSHIRAMQTLLMLSQIESPPLNVFLSALEADAETSLSAGEDHFADRSDRQDRLRRFSLLLSGFLSSRTSKKELETHIGNLFYTPSSLTDESEDSSQPAYNAPLSERELSKRAADALGSYLMPAKQALTSPAGCVCYGGDSAFAILRQTDGTLVQLSRSYTPQSAVISSEKALDLCRKWLKKHLKEAGSLTLVGSEESDGFLHAVFERGADRVSLSLSLDSGRICHYDATDFLRS